MASRSPAADIDTLASGRLPEYHGDISPEGPVTTEYSHLATLDTKLLSKASDHPLSAEDLHFLDADVMFAAPAGSADLQFIGAEVREHIIKAFDDCLQSLREEQMQFLLKIENSMSVSKVSQAPAVDSAEQCMGAPKCPVLDKAMDESKPISSPTSVPDPVPCEEVAQDRQIREAAHTGTLEKQNHEKLDPELDRMVILDTSGLTSRVTSFRGKTPASGKVKVQAIPTLTRAEDGAFDYHLDLMNRMEDQDNSVRLKKQKIMSACRCHLLPWLIPQDSFIVRWVHTDVFETLCSIVMLLFALSVGIEADANIQAARQNAEDPTWSVYPMWCFSLWFAFEVTARVLADQGDFFVGQDWRWNWFDLGLALLSVFDMIAMLSQSKLAFVRVLRTLKVVRAVRVVRLVRWFHELRLMLASIFSSLAALFWTVMFLVIVTFLCSVAILQGCASHYRKEHEKNVNATTETMRQINLYYPDVLTAMYTLIGSISGGIDWMDAAKPLWHIGPLYGLAFTLFVLVSILGILNVVTSMFVERAQNMKKTDRDFAIADQLHTTRCDLKETTALFRQLDTEHKGVVNVEDLHKFLRDDNVCAHFKTLDIDVTDRARIENMLDVDHNGYVSLQQFIVGCVGLRGRSNKADLLLAIAELQKTYSHVHTIEDKLAEVALDVERLREIAEKQAASKWFAGGLARAHNMQTR